MSYKEREDNYYKSLFCKLSFNEVGKYLPEDVTIKNFKNMFNLIHQYYKLDSLLVLGAPIQCRDIIKANLEVYVSQ